MALCLQCFDCGAVALIASFFSFCVLDGKCKVLVSIPDHCLPFYFERSLLNTTESLINLTLLLLLNTTCPILANSVDPDQLASEEANDLDLHCLSINV